MRRYMGRRMILGPGDAARYAIKRQKKEEENSNKSAQSRFRFRLLATPARQASLAFF